MADRLTLLLVDDDEDVLVAIKIKLERTGRFDVHTATDGREALGQVRQLRPALVISDIDMPDMDGGELAAALKANPATANVPVVFLSAMVSPEDSERGPVGGWPMISKRSPVEHIVRKIDDVLAGKL